MTALLDAVSWIALALGGLFCIIGGVGLLRMPDFFSRLHAGGITDTAGTGLVLFGLMLQGGLSLVTVKLILLFIFIQITSPTAVHALARAALRSGVRPMLGREGEGPSR